MSGKSIGKRYRMMIRNEQHSTDRRFSFPFDLSNLMNRKRYVCFKKITFEYTPVLQKDHIGSIDIRIIDSRKPITNDSRVVIIRVYANEHQVFVVSDIEWSYKAERCPWSLEVVANISNVELNTAVGDLKITPQYSYTNAKPAKLKMKVEAYKNDPKIMITKVPDALNYKYDAKSVYVFSKIGEVQLLDI